MKLTIEPATVQKLDDAFLWLKRASFMSLPITRRDEAFNLLASSKSEMFLVYGDDQPLAAFVCYYAQELVGEQYCKGYIIEMLHAASVHDCLSEILLKISSTLYSQREARWIQLVAAPKMMPYLEDLDFVIENVITTKEILEPYEEENDPLSLAIH